MIDFQKELADFEPHYDYIDSNGNRVVEDGYGGGLILCGREKCTLEWVRPGKSQCWWCEEEERREIVEFLD